MRRIAVAALLLCLTGCTGNKFAPVRGRVTMGTKPVTSGMIMFQPADGPAAIGAIGPDGAYELVTSSDIVGARVGPHRVTIQSTKVTSGRLVEPKSIADETGRGSANGGGALVPGEVIWLVPRKYSQVETSGLTADVNPGANEIDFKLSAD